LYKPAGFDGLRRAESEATICVAPRAVGDEQSAKADFVSL